VVDQHWSASPLDYDRAALAVRWLAEHYGMDSVMEVIWGTARTGSFATAFVDSFGLTRLEFERQFEEAMRAHL
jgi:hypothetical protein